MEFQPVGAIYIGEKDGSVTDRIREIHALLDGDVSCCISREILLDIWRKYMFNAAFNTVESILRCRHRWFQQLPEANAALECVMEEIVRLANACGVMLSEADIRHWTDTASLIPATDCAAWPRICGPSGPRRSTC